MKAEYLKREMFPFVLEKVCKYILLCAAILI